MKFLNVATPFLVALASFAQVNAIGVHCNKHIIVKEGDACDNITGYSPNKSYYLRIKDLLLYNPNMDCNNLKIGEQLCVEADYENEDQPWNAYFIKRGDTCESLARKLRTSIQILENINNYLNCDRIENQVNVEIKFRLDGEYYPVFDDSEWVSVDGN